MREMIEPLSRIGEVTVIGGLVRDLAFYGPEERPVSDIDLVVRGLPSALQTFAESSGATPNKFGGYGLHTAAFKADFWSLSSTWAKRAGHVSMRKPTDLVKCTFFDWDAIVYSIQTKKITAIPGYLSRLHGRVLDLNLEPNPSIKGNLVRALRRVMMWDVRPGPRLRRFIDGAVCEHNWAELAVAESQAFHTTYLSQFRSAREYYRDVLRNPAFRGVGRDDMRQVSLDLFREVQHQYMAPSETHFMKFDYPRPRKFRRIRSDTRDLFDDR